MSFEKSIRDLRQQGYAEVPGLSVDRRTELFSALGRLIENNYYELLASRIDDTGRGYGRGGFREVPPEVKDNDSFAVSKEAFLYDPAFREIWGDSLSTDVKEFVDLCHDTYDIAMVSVHSIARSLEELPKYKGFAGKVMTADGQSSGRLTVQRYNIPNRDDPNRQLFGSHRDTSMLSMHLGDTHPGFYFTDRARVRTPYDLQEDNGVLFVGKQWDQTYPDSEIRARFHGVDLPADLGDIQRSSAVLFVDELGFTREK